MKLRITIWTLAWDTDAGTDCRVFSSEAAWSAFFRGVIESTIHNVHTEQADAIRQALRRQDMGFAYELWQRSYKPELDTYNWNEQTVEISASPESVLIPD